MAKTSTQRDKDRRNRNEKAGKIRAQVAKWVPEKAKPVVVAAMSEAGDRALRRWKREQSSGDSDG